MNISTETTPHALVAHAAGRLDFNAASTFQKDLEALVTQAHTGQRGLVLNCLKLEYVSSAGLRGFLIGARAAKTAGVGFVVCNLQAAVQEVFDVSGFSRLIACSPSQTAAIEAVQGRGSAA